MSNKKLELIRKKNLSQKEEAFFVISTSPPYGGGVGGEASGEMVGGRFVFLLLSKRNSHVVNLS